MIVKLEYKNLNHTQNPLEFLWRPGLGPDDSNCVALNNIWFWELKTGTIFKKN